MEKNTIIKIEKQDLREKEKEKRKKKRRQIHRDTIEEEVKNKK